MQSGHPARQTVRFTMAQIWSVFSDAGCQIIKRPARRAQQYWELMNRSRLKNATWFRWTVNIEQVPKYHLVGNLYGFEKLWEYGLEASKNELGMADFRVTTMSN